MTTFPGAVHLIDNDQKLEAVADAMRAALEFGFDTETRPSFKKGEVHKVALLQLATETDAYLIRLHRITQFNFIKTLFENETVIKAGIAIRDDLRSLQKVCEFTPRNFIELQTIAREKKLENLGLKGMAKEVLGFDISKGPKLTNWEARDLTTSQLMYAATDAWIGLKLYQKLKSP